MPKILSSNVHYSMHQVDDNDSDFSFLADDTLKTIFLHSGTMEINLEINSINKTIKLNGNEGINIMPDINFSITSNKSYAVTVQSKKDGNPIIEIVDVNGKRSEAIIENYKIIQNPKQVNKPWGHEIWISWFKNHHVLKKIYMIEGNKCSLQYHEEKSETNLIVKGKANVLKDIKLREGMSEKDALSHFNSIKNIDSYIVNMSPGDFWDNKPFEIHRVFSIYSYTAYEASTNQLDDVVRLQDDNNRVSGFIKAEHN